MNLTPGLIAELPNLAAPVIEKFGGPANMARLTGHPVTRIEGWARIGNIAEKYRPWLYVVARQHSIPHTPWDWIAHLVEIPIAA